MDPATARAMLGIEPRTLLTGDLVEAAYADALRAVAQVEHHDPDVAGRRRQLQHARVVLLKRSSRLPPRGDALVPLFLVQFFVGGFALFAAGIAVVVTWGAGGYDGALSLIGWTFGAVYTALASMVIALLVGLPLRLVPSIRGRWLANGELTVAGVVVGLVALNLVFAAAPVSMVVDLAGPYESRDVNGWALFLAWSLFAFSVAHFVWPLRWTARDVR